MSNNPTTRTEPTRTESTNTFAKMDASGSGSSWRDAVPKSVGQEDSLSPELSAEIWAKIYKDVGVSDERGQKEVRAAVYVYLAINGTSRVGSYSAELKTASGKTFSSAVIPRHAHSLIRKFMRANMDESYEFFKETRVMESHPRFISRVAEIGVGPQQAFATADWLTDCSFFTPEEKKAHTNSFKFAIQRASRAREGKTLERVEKDNTDEVLHAQGDFKEGPVQF